MERRPRTVSLVPWGGPGLMLAGLSAPETQAQPGSLSGPGVLLAQSVPSFLSPVIITLLLYDGYVVL